MGSDEDRSYYLIEICLSGVGQFVIWFDHRVDGVVLDELGNVATFPNLEVAKEYAGASGIDLEPNPPVSYNLDRVRDWVEATDDQPVNCDLLLGAWNLLLDIGNSVGRDLQEPADARVVYDKLFWGTNPPSLTPPGERFEPTWSAKDQRVLREVLRNGFEVLGLALSIEPRLPG